MSSLKILPQILIFLLAIHSVCFCQDENVEIEYFGGTQIVEVLCDTPIAIQEKELNLQFEGAYSIDGGMTEVYVVLNECLRDQNSYLEALNHNLIKYPQWQTLTFEVYEGGLLEKLFELPGVQKAESIVLILNEDFPIPRSIINFRNISSLSIYGDDLTEIPEEIGTLTELTKLEIEVTDLSILPPSLANLCRLNELSIRGNNTMFPFDISCFDSLQMLMLEINGLKELQIWADSTRLWYIALNKGENLEKIYIRGKSTINIDRFIYLFGPLPKLNELNSINNLGNKLHLEITEVDMGMLIGQIVKLNNLVELNTDVLSMNKIENYSVLKNLVKPDTIRISEVLLTEMPSKKEKKWIKNISTNKNCKLCRKNKQPSSMIMTLNSKIRKQLRKNYIEIIDSENLTQAVLLYAKKR